MGILDGIGSLIGGGGSPDSGLAGQAMSLLTGKDAGGLEGLVKQFSAAGHGDLIASWIGTNQNLPISIDQLTQALGHGKIQALAAGAGVPFDQAAGKLTELLPGLVDKLTPNGTVPSAADLLTAATSMLGSRGSNG